MDGEIEVACQVASDAIATAIASEVFLITAPGTVG